MRIRGSLWRESERDVVDGWMYGSFVGCEDGGVGTVVEGRPKCFHEIERKDGLFMGVIGSIGWGFFC